MPEVADSPPAPVAVIAALREEIQPLLRRSCRLQRTVCDGRPLVRAWLGACPIVATWTGEGRRHAAAGAELLLRSAPGARLLVLGIAGAISPDLRVGDLVIGSTVRDDEGSFGADPEWLRTASGVEGARLGTVATVDRVVAGAAQKEELWRRLGRPPVTVVDMESASFAAAARRSGIPFLVVRAVSDEATEDLPDLLESCRDRQGGIDRRRVAMRALLRPRTVPVLLGLRRRLHLGAERLARHAAAVVEQPLEVACGS